VQRIPVKIVFDDPASGSILRVGMSVEPIIDTKATAVAQSDRPTGSAPAARPTAALASAR
jgi:membrane fusion protein, multidrug efflux system